MDFGVFFLVMESFAAEGIFMFLTQVNLLFCTLQSKGICGRYRHRGARLSLQCYPWLTWLSIIFSNITRQKSSLWGWQEGLWSVSFTPFGGCFHCCLICHYNIIIWVTIWGEIQGGELRRRSLIEDILYTSFMEHGELSDFLNFLWIRICVFVEVGWVAYFMMGV